ncbi:oligosaccharide flippase family protein [Desulfocastanea catecholica]
MNQKRDILRGTFVLSIGEAVVYGSSFLKNMIFARLLTKEDFGIAATFAMALTILEFSSKMSISRLIVQDLEGDNPHFMASAHAIQLIASILSAIIVFLAAGPLVTLFDVKGSILSYQLLAFLPIIKGLEHLDLSRLERKFRYMQSTIASAGPQLVTSLAAWPLAILIPNYNVVLIILFSKAIGSTVISHLIATRPYKLGINHIFCRRIIQFSWPLVVNGFLLFLVFQGDQFIIASYYSMEDLASFAATFSIATVPTFIFGRIFPAIMLPVMAKVQNDLNLFRQKYKVTLEIVCIFTIFYGVSSILGAEAIMKIVFGVKFEGNGAILAWLTAAYAIRSIRFAPTIAALAKADSITQMYSNLVRGITLPISLVLAILHQPIWMIAATGVISEVAACSVSFYRLAYRNSVPLRYSMRPVLITVLLLTFSGLPGLFGFYKLNTAVVIFLAPLFGIICSGVMILFFSSSRKYIEELLKKNDFKV